VRVPRAAAPLSVTVTFDASLPSAKTSLPVTLPVESVKTSLG
jgi:hypothetical protein